MSIESKLPSRENPGPGQSRSDATLKPPKGEHIENRETDTDTPNKEIVKPEVDTIVPRTGRAR